MGGHGAKRSGEISGKKELNGRRDAVRDSRRGGEMREYEGIMMLRARGT